jgi:hypothetical protein
VNPPSHLVLAVSQFATTLLFGMGVMASMRVKGFWKRMLLFTPTMAAVSLSEVFVPRLADASIRSVGPYLIGFFFGIVLMASGFNPRRGRKVSKP